MNDVSLQSYVINSTRSDVGRIDLDVSIDTWIERFRDRPGIEMVPLGYNAAAHSYRLFGLEHRDPADRLLIATAIEIECPLVTYDERIRHFSQRHGRNYGFTAAV